MKTNQSKFDFLSSLSVENLCISDYLHVEDCESINSFSDLSDYLSDKNAFDVEVIYYSKAIEYLLNNDASLRESLAIASDMGFELKNLGSGVLASLLASKNCQIEFQELESEVNAFFEDEE